MSDVRFILSASLNNLIRQIDIEDNVSAAEQALRQASEISDETLLQISRSRSEQGMLGEQYSYDRLQTVGNYRLTRFNRKNAKIIRCRRENDVIDFIFAKDPEYELSDSLLGLARNGKKYTEQEFKDASTRAIISSVASKEVKSQNEAVLGRADSLESYILSRVELLEGIKFEAFGKTFCRDRRVIYPI